MGFDNVDWTSLESVLWWDLLLVMLKI
jgi:hypothetical protein